MLVITILALSMSAAFGATTTWIDGTGSWFHEENWDTGVVPDSTTDVFINNGGTAQITIDFKALALSLTLGQYAGDSGTVSVSPGHAGLDVGGTIFVGYRGRGTLLINEPGGVTSSGASIASLTSGPAVSHGAVKVDGAHATWTISGEADVGGTTSGAGGTGLLTVTNGGTVTAASVHVYTSGTLTGNGTVTTTSGTTVDGTLEPSGGTLTMGGDLSFGTLGTMESNVVPASADNVDVSGVASLSGRLKVRMTGTFTSGTTYTLLTADVGVLGTFSMESINFPPGQNFTPKITYDTHHVYLYLQPNT